MPTKSFDSDAYLIINDATYSRLVSTVRRGLKANDSRRSLSEISVAAGFAAAFHTGRFFDGRIENLLVEMGEQLAVQPMDAQWRSLSQTIEDIPRRRVLHVATHVAE